MATKAPRPRNAACWCGNREMDVFNAEYGRCRSCGGLVLLDEGVPGRKPVVNDEEDFYGKQYWLQHQEGDLGNPDIHARARTDLPERNLHWLAALLAYKLPPSQVLEVGCAHGSFVALMKLAGFGASGSEMSPWVVDYARRTFGIPMHVGPVESLDIAPGSLDALLMMDVLEHLPDPPATLRRCLALLKDDGVLVIQTPVYREGTTHEQMVASADPFLEQLKPEEHLYLFSERGVRRLFDEIGATHVAFEPAIFAHYDMFLVASRKPLARNETAAIEAALLATPGGRIALALLDLRQRQFALIAELAQAKSDVEFLKNLAAAGQVEQDRVSASHDADVAAMQSDRATRGDVIESQRRRIEQLEAEVHARLEELKALYEQAEALRNERNLLDAQRADARRNFELVEADRVARGKVIEEQGQAIATLQGLVHSHLSDLEMVNERHAALEQRHAALEQRHAALEQRLAALAGEHAAASADRDRLRAEGERRAAELQRLEGALAAREQLIEKARATRWLRFGRALGLDSLDEKK